MVNGNNILIYLTGNNAVLDWGSGAIVKLKGLASGSLMAMLIWNPTANSSPHKLGCHSTSFLEGAIYSPGTEVQVGSNGGVNGSADWTIWAVKRLQIGSSSGLTIKVNFSASATPMPIVLADGGLNYQVSSAPPSVSKVLLKR